MADKKRIEKIKGTYQKARDEFEQLLAKDRKSQSAWDQLDDLEEDMYELARERAELQGDEYVTPLRDSALERVAWNLGAPCPTVVSGARQALLGFFTSRQDAEDLQGVTRGEFVEEDASSFIAVVSFESVVYVKRGFPWEDALADHPLSETGLESGGAFTVQRSRLIRSIYRAGSLWKGRLNHYLFVFQDEVFECLASNFDVSLHFAPYENVLRHMADSLGGP